VRVRGHAFVVPRLVLALCAWSPRAQGRLPVPPAAALASAQEGLLDALARVAVAAPGKPMDGLLHAVRDDSLPPAVRFLLCEHVERCARAAGDVQAGLAGADVRSEVFTIERAAARAACLAAFRAAGAVPAQVLAGAYLGEAERGLELEGVDVEASLRVAVEVAASDRPAGLLAWVRRRAADVRCAVAAAAACRAVADDAKLRARYLSLHRDLWRDGLEMLRRSGGREGRVADAKLAAGEAEEGQEEDADGQGDPFARVRCAEEWISESTREAEPMPRRALLRRAMMLLTDVESKTWPWIGNDPDALKGPESDRARLLLAQVTDRAAALGVPGVDVLRFATPGDLDRLLVDRGEWRADGGLLVGRSTGAATRATTRFAWRDIEAVTIRGGIRSADGLNFRLAVGDVNLLLNWEVADENHAWFGDAQIPSSPRCLTAGREHVIQLRQVRELVAILIDGNYLLTGPGKLAGSISVYPALGSEIFVRSIEVIGNLDLARVVTGPTGPTR